MLETYREDLEAKHRNAERLATIGQFAASIGHELRNPLGVVESSLYLLRQHLRSRGRRSRHVDEAPGPHRQRGPARQQDDPRPARSRPQPSAPQRRGPRCASWSTARAEAALLPAAITLDVAVPADLTARHRSRSGPADAGQPVDQRRAGAARDGATIWVEAETRRGRGARLRVRDDGPGIPPQDRARIFEALYTTKAKGSGLGLALCRRIMEAHGGTIELEASATGASFLLTFAGCAERGHERPRPHRRRRRGAVREPRRDRPAAWASRPIIARDRQSALAHAAAHDFDVALIDVRLPDGDGMSLLAPLRERSPFLQVGDGHRQRVGRGRDRGRARRRVRLRAQAGLAARPARHRPGARSIRRRSTASASACAASSNAPSNAIASWSSPCPRSCWRWTRRAASRPGTASSNASPGYARAEMLGTDGRRFVGDGRAPRRPAAQGGRQAQGPLAPRRGEGARRPEHRLRGRHRRHRRGRDAAPAAPFRAAGGRRHAGRRAGARGAQPAELGVAAAHRAGAPARSRRRAGDQSLPIARIIKSEIDRLDRLVREFLAFAQPRPLEPRPVDVADLLAGGRRADRAGGGVGARRDRRRREPRHAGRRWARRSGCARCCST